MARPLVISFLLLATMANAAVTTQYDCAYIPSGGSCDVNCVENKNTQPATMELGKCTTGTRERNNEIYYYAYECGKDGHVQKVEYYDNECKIENGQSIPDSDFSCKTTDKYGSLKVVTVSADADTALMITFCNNGNDCDDKGCVQATVKSVSGGCVNVEGYSFKAKELAAGDTVVFLSGYSGTGCKRENLLFQGEFEADGHCTRLRQTTVYKCDAAAHYTTKSCGFVPSCGACSESSETSTGLENKCMNNSMPLFLSFSSSKTTCSGGKTTVTTYNDEKCTENKHTSTTTESCVYSNEAKYVKMASGNTIYVCSTKKDCVASSSDSCTSLTTSAPVKTDGKCVYDSAKRFSYKATKNGDKYRLAVFKDNKCEKVSLQGEFTPGECVMVREATKTECSGAFSTSAMFTVSAVVAVMSLLLF